MTCCCCNDDNSLMLKIKKGETLGFAFSIERNCSPVDLTGAQVIFQVRENIEDTGVFVINKTITENSNIETVGCINEPTEGKFVVMVLDSEIEDLSVVKPYFFAMYLEQNNVRKCISANANGLAQLIVLNP